MAEKNVYFATFLVCLFLLLLYLNYETNEKLINNEVFFNKLFDEDTYEDTGSRNILPVDLLENKQPKLLKSIQDTWIVVTTSKDPGEEIDYLTKMENVKVLVVALESTNPKWNHPGAIYLSLKMQESLNYGIAKLIPKNSYCRKMIGYLYAIQHGAKFIYDTDDHVQLLKPLNEHFNFNETGYGLTLKRMSSDHIMFNPFEHFGQVNMWPKGLFPNILRDKIGNDYINSKHKTSYIQHGLIKGVNADIDNVFRTTKDGNYKDIEVNFDEIAPPVELPLNVYAPYSSKNTLFHYEAFWSLYLPLSVPERYSDIYRSYWGQRLLWLFDGTVSHHGPNAQSNKDHKVDYSERYKEDEEYRKKCEDLIRLLNGWTCWKINSYDCGTDLIKEMISHKYLDKSEIEFIKAWFDDLGNVGYVQSEDDFSKSSSTNEILPIRFTPRVQENNDANSKCCPDKKVEPYRQPDSLIYLNNFCRNAFTKIDINYKKPQKPIGKYALVVTFNHMTLVSNMLFLKHFFGHYFHHVIFCGSRINGNIANSMNEFDKIDSISFIEFTVHYGFFHHQCMNKAIEMNFNADGILLISDDVMLKYWKLHNDLDFNKIWFTRKVACWEEMDPNNTMAVENQKWIWNGRWGLKPLFETWNDFNLILNGTIKVDEEHKDMLKRFLSTLESNYEVKGKYPKVCWGQSDMFYLPKTKYKEFHYITSLFQRHNVFLELVVGTVLSGLAPLKEIDIIRGSYQWECNHCFSFDWDYSKVESLYKNFTHFYHPVKLGLLTRGTGNKNFCNLFVKDKIENG